MEKQSLENRTSAINTGIEQLKTYAHELYLAKKDEEQLKKKIATWKVTKARLLMQLEKKEPELDAITNLVEQYKAEVKGSASGSDNQPRG